uniref:Uncharacterized protein AlNc14C504G11966 n=1 Tax=Albugo laibachii Nc14 TaxID=890382 RepID=F0X0M2_9STRA|nr:conserved hypothetical protein [Albugo laibachii Nc14]|eukprot:CCA27313.1 conserved hypothetical protein [Albugo laibachii Nc14]
MTNSEGQQLVVVIHYTKLQDALVDRQAIHSNWMDEYTAVRSAIHVSYPLPILQDDESIKSLRKSKISQALTYFDCKMILDCLMQSQESKQTNFLGQYTSPILTQWISIVKMYEKSNLHIAEGATRLNEIISSSLSALRIELQSYKRQIGLKQQRIYELHEAIQGYRHKADTMCSKYGIQVTLKLRIDESTLLVSLY